MLGGLLGRGESESIVGGELPNGLGCVLGKAKLGDALFFTVGAAVFGDLDGSSIVSASAVGDGSVGGARVGDWVGGWVGGRVGGWVGNGVWR